MLKTFVWPGLTEIAERCVPPVCSMCVIIITENINHLLEREAKKTNNSTMLNQRFTMPLMLLLCFSFVALMALSYWTDRYGNITMYRTKFSAVKQDRPTETITEFREHAAIVEAIKQILDNDFNTTINLRNVLKLRDMATKAGFSSNVLIPEHQMENPKTRSKVTLNRLTGVHSNKRYNVTRFGTKKKTSRQLSVKSRLRKGGKTIPSYRTCAVVGNSGILLNSGCGAEIDAHDFVMRSNLASITEFIKDVGNKTNVMSINYHETKELLHCIRSGIKSCQPFYQVARFRQFPHAVLWFSKLAYISIRDHLTFVNYLRQNNLGILVAYPFKRMMTQVKRFWKMKGSPSSGLYLYTVALPKCDRISLYGFYPFDTSPDGRPLVYHYDGTYPDRFNNSHNMPREYERLLEMSKDGGYFRMLTEKCVLQKSVIL
ncbi:uncharacterized protein [Antedon mediterranea]|uniref:uncharacterized protein n=1 Tax=Antedon mediterranea TaxID=105859 RepID=UPI003AF74405